MSSKHEPLTEAEMADFSPAGPWLDWLDEYAARTDRQPRDIRVLDWGCGRGRLVARLLEHGYDAYGIDVDPEAVENGWALLRDRGFVAEERLRVFDPERAVPFEAAGFHAVLSDQVLEHVTSLDSVAEELARLTRGDGFGLHIFPSHLRVREPHLHMPFVHWLPKGGLRRAYITAMVHCGREPSWTELEGAPAQERVARYYDYSVQRTWYRGPRELRRTLTSHGLAVTLMGSGGGSRTLAAMKRFTPLRAVAIWWQCQFHSTWVATGRAPPAQT